MRSEHDDAAAVAAGLRQMLAPADVAQQVRGEITPTVRDDEVGEADGEVPEDVPRELRARRHLEIGPHASEVRLDPRSLIQQRTGGDTAQHRGQPQPRAAWQRRGDYGGRPIRRDVIEPMRVPARRACRRRNRGRRRRGRHQSSHP